MSEVTAYRIGDTVLHVHSRDRHGVLVTIHKDVSFLSPRDRLDEMSLSYEKVHVPVSFWEAFEKLWGLRTELVGLYEAFFKRYERTDGEDPFWALNRFVDGLWTRVAKLHREWRR